MKNDLLSKLNDIREQVAKNYKAMPKLVELQAEAKKAFDERIDHLLTQDNLIRKIRVPKLHLPVLRIKGKTIRIPINWRYLVSTPFIYGMIIPALIWHSAIELYHQICFRLYGIPLVNFREYFINDRQLLSMLNIFEKINCIYCSYVNNLIRYSAEIGGRTERYWCPIKYYRRINNPHSQYSKFVDGENIEEMREQWEELRDFSDLTGNQVDKSNS
jgi:hypothetical protein